MCLIVFAPNIRNAVIRKPVLQRGFEGNSHGCGIAYIEDGAVKIEKGFFTFEKFFNTYSAIRQRITSGPILIHFRFATCGEHNKTNSQPIAVRDDLVMAHNGVFSELSFPELNISDSVLLARNLNKMGMPFPISNPYRLILNALCAGYSKLVFFDKNGKWDIICSELGAWRNGVWYSDKGECLKREVYTGWYKSKKWRKSRNSVTKPKKLTKKELEENWCLPPDYTDNTDLGNDYKDDVDKAWPIAKPAKPLKPLGPYNYDYYNNKESPFGERSTYCRPQTFNAGFSGF